jgi:hypothetical protein
VVRFAGLVGAGARFFAEARFCGVAFGFAVFFAAAFAGALLREGETAFAFLVGILADVFVGAAVGDSTPGSSSDALWSAGGAPETAR